MDKQECELWLNVLYQSMAQSNDASKAVQQATVAVQGWRQANQQPWPETGVDDPPPAF